jgi:ribosomal protein S18 acetylase RimI-like enzyme
MDSGAAPAAVAVRSARADDLDRLLALLSQLSEDGEPTTATPALAATFVRILAEGGRTILVAETAEGLVGTLDLVIVPALSHGGRPWAAIENVVVDAGWRRRGVGRKLMDRAVAIAAAADCSEVQLVSHERRHEAHVL